MHTCIVYAHINVGKNEMFPLHLTFCDIDIEIIEIFTTTMDSIFHKGWA